MSSTTTRTDARSLRSRGDTHGSGHWASPKPAVAPPHPSSTANHQAWTLRDIVHLPYALLWKGPYGQSLAFAYLERAISRSADRSGRRTRRMDRLLGGKGT